MGETEQNKINLHLHNLKQVCVANLLDDLIKDVSIVYAESTKYRNLWLKKVNVERLENVSWTRTVSIRNIESNSVQNVSAETIYYGENYGYWQLYLTYKGEPYKLGCPDCELYLSPKCNEKELEITIKLDNICRSKIQANFVINGKKEIFPMIQEAALIKGIQIIVINNLEDDISNVNLWLSEEYKSRKNDELDDEISTKITLNKWRINKGTNAKSREIINFANCGANNIWKLHFLYRGYCYELDTKSTGKMNLMPSDHGTTLTIFISHEQRTKSIRAKFSFSDRDKEYQVKQTGKVNKKIETVKGLAKKLNGSTKNCLTNVLTSLSTSVNRLADIFVHLGHDFKLLSSQDNSKLLEKYEFETAMCNPLKSDNIELAVADFISKSFEIRTIIEGILRDLRELKSSWKEIQIEAKRLENLLMDLIDEYFLDEADYEQNNNYNLKNIYFALKRFDLLVVVRLLSQIIEIAGCTKDGLIFKMSNYKLDKFFVCKVVTLASELIKELDMCKKIGFDLGKSMISDSKTPFDQEVLNRSFRIGTELFYIVRSELVKRLFTTASDLHSKNRNVNGTMVGSSAVGIVGGVLTIVGVAAAIPTVGASLALTATGIALGVAGGATGLITGIVDSALTSKFLNDTVDLVLTDQSLGSFLSTLEWMQSRNETHGVTKDDRAEQTALMSTRVTEKLAQSFVNAGVRATKVAVAFTRIAAVGARAGAAAPGLLFDLTSLISNSVSLARGSRCELGYKLEMQAIQLQEAMELIKLQTEN